MVNLRPTTSTFASSAGPIIVCPSIICTTRMFSGFTSSTSSKSGECVVASLAFAVWPHPRAATKARIASGCNADSGSSMPTTLGYPYGGTFWNIAVNAAARSVPSDMLAASDSSVLSDVGEDNQKRVVSYSPYCTGASRSICGTTADRKRPIRSKAHGSALLM